MTEVTNEQQLRKFMLVISAGIFAATPVELILVEHTGDLLQWIPFMLSGLGLLALGWFWFSPTNTSITSLRWSMMITAAGSLYGVYEHFISNYTFSAEIHPSYTLFENIQEALMGASPMMAPGIFLLSALLAVAATYKHPSLGSK